MTRLSNRSVLLSDLLLVTFTPTFAFILRFDGFDWVPGYNRTVLLFSVVALGTKLLVFWLFGLYRREWRTASVEEMVLIVKAVLLGSGIAGVVGSFALPMLGVIPHRVPYSVPVIDALLTMAATGGVRFSVRMLEGRR